MQNIFPIGPILQFAELWLSSRPRVLSNVAGKSTRQFNDFPIATFDCQNDIGKSPWKLAHLYRMNMMIYLFTMVIFNSYMFKKKTDSKSLTFMKSPSVDSEITGG